jgi:carbon starvation protein
MIYGFAAAVLPVWLLLAPRDYLSTFLKVGVVFALALAIISLAPEVKMPALTAFAANGDGPIFKGDLFPFVFITIACGAISGFHSLVASGTTPKLLARETDVRMIGYGSMAIESFVAVMAVIAATVLDPGVYFAINIDLGMSAADTVALISSWGPQYGVTLEQMQALAAEMGLPSLFGRTGGAPSLAVGMASIFSASFGGGLMKFWYHFAIMFEVLFILTTLDAGTRVGRFMLQDFGRHFWPRFGDLASYPMAVLASLLFVGAWGYFLWQGVTDPKGGIRFLWPLFGISNQVLAGIALAVATGVLVKMGKLRFAWITALPLAWLSIVVTTAALQKVFSPDPELGFLAGAAALVGQLADGSIPLEKMAETRLQITAFRIDAVLTFLFAALLWVIILDMLRVSLRVVRGRGAPPLAEVPYQASARAGAAGGA